MSVDDTIRELSGTISQLGLLVAKINEQIGGISSRVNMTLQTFDDSVSGIAKDANKMTAQVDSTIAQIPGTWAFYLLFSTLLAVLFLLAVLIIINLVLKIQSIFRLLRDESSRVSTPLEPLVQPEPPMKRPSPGYSSSYPTRPSDTTRLRQIAVEMESEPRRYGVGQSPPVGAVSGRTGPTIYHHHHHPPQQTTVAAMEFYGNGKGGASPAGDGAGRPFGGGSGASASPRSQQV